MKRRLICTALAASLSLAGCGPIMDKSNIADDDAALISEEITETDMDNEQTQNDELSEPDVTDARSSSDNGQNSEFKYFKVTANGDWYVNNSEPEENFILLGNNNSSFTRIAVEADDSGEYASAVYMAGESRAYYKNQNYDFIKNETTDLYGKEAIHHISVDFEGNYYENYFLDLGQGVVCKVSLYFDNDFYRENRESADDILKNIEFFCSDAPKKDDEITMKDIVEANRLANILSIYDSVNTNVRYGLKTYDLYADHDFRGLGALAYAEGQIGDRLCQLDSGEYSTIFSYEPVDLYENQFFMKDMMDYFMITDIRKKGKKEIITAEISDDVSKMFLDEFDNEYKDGDKVLLEISLDPNTLIINELSVRSVSLIKKDELFTMKCKYNTHKDLVLKQMYDHMNTDDLRTITALVNPGMKNEYTVSVRGVKGDGIQRVEFGDRVITGEYEDPEMTKEYNKGTDKDKNADLLFYAREFF